MLNGRHRSWESRIYNKPISEKRHSDTRDRRKKKSLKQRGPIVLIVGAVLFIAGPIIAIVGGIQLASTFATPFMQERNILINQVSIEPGSSVEAATTQLTDISRPITVAIHIQRLGERGADEGDDGLLQQRLQQQQLQLPREQREARLIETVTDPSGTVLSNNEFSANLFTDFQPQTTGNHILNVTNAGATNVTIYGIFGYLPLLTAARSFEEGGQSPLSGVDLSGLSGVIVGGLLTAIGYITIIAGIIIVVIDSRKRGQRKGGFSGVTEGGISYRTD